MRLRINVQWTLFIEIVLINAHQYWGKMAEFFKTDQVEFFLLRCTDTAIVTLFNRSYRFFLYFYVSVEFLIVLFESDFDRVFRNKNFYC